MSKVGHLKTTPPSEQSVAETTQVDVRELRSLDWELSAAKKKEEEKKKALCAKSVMTVGFRRTQSARNGRTSVCLSLEVSNSGGFCSGKCYICLLFCRASLC